MEETQAQQTEQTAVAEGQTENEAAREETISKKLYDSKVSEMNKTIKELKAQLSENMSADEKAAQAQNEMQQALKEARDEVAQLRTENALAAAGISSASSQKLSRAIVSAECESIVSAIKETAAELIKDTEARVKRELLEQGSPQIGIDGGVPAKPDRYMETVKKAVSHGKETPRTKWLE